MEKSVQIIQQGALVERPYQDRNGQQQVFASMGWTLTDGIDTFYAELAASAMYIPTLRSCTVCRRR